MPLAVAIAERVCPSTTSYSSTPPGLLHSNVITFDAVYVVDCGRMGRTRTRSQRSSTRSKPTLHVHSQRALRHAPVALAGTTHRAPHAPQWSSESSCASQPLSARASQSPKPALHVMPQRVPSHVASAFVADVHRAHVGPQLVTELPPTHASGASTVTRSLVTSIGSRTSTTAVSASVLASRTAGMSIATIPVSPPPSGET
ncbi:MAG: hypothetical protein JNK05_08030 [Myxococcales bacterium]|nr:hypothetical protein [Myxococcales bacterium]